MSLAGPDTNTQSASVSSFNLTVQVSNHNKAKAAVPHAAESNNAGVDMVEDLILDVEAYKEQLNQSLEALAASLSDLDQGVANIEARTIKKKQEEPAIVTVRRKQDPLQQIYDDLMRHLNQNGSQTLMAVHGKVSGEKVLSLLKS